MGYVNEVYPFVRVIHVTHEHNPPPPHPTPNFTWDPLSYYGYLFQMEWIGFFNVINYFNRYKENQYGEFKFYNR